MRRILQAALVLGLAGANLAAPPPDRFAAYFSKFDASGYRHCGRLPLGGANRSQVDVCVLKAFAEGAPFIALYDQQGIDSEVALGLEFSKSKVLTVIQFDNWSCSTPNCAHPESCNSPRITKSKTGIRVQCTTEYDL